MVAKHVWKESDSPAAGRGLRRRARAAQRPAGFPAAAAACGVPRPARQAPRRETAAATPAAAAPPTLSSAHASHNEIRLPDPSSVLCFGAFDPANSMHLICAIAPPVLCTPPRSSSYGKSLLIMFPRFANNRKNKRRNRTGNVIVHSRNSQRLTRARLTIKGALQCSSKFSLSAD